MVHKVLFYLPTLFMANSCLQFYCHVFLRGVLCFQLLFCFVLFLFFSPLNLVLGPTPPNIVKLGSNEVVFTLLLFTTIFRLTHGAARISLCTSFSLFVLFPPLMTFDSLEGFFIGLFVF